MKKRMVFTRLVILVLIFAMVCPYVSAAEQASYYLDSYNAYMYAAGNRYVRAYFDVEGTDYMDEIGALSVKIYESDDDDPDGDWTWKKTFTHSDTSGMLVENDYSHSGYVSYRGTAGKYYRAYVGVWAGVDGDGDSRYFYTDIVRAY
ncbi:MAG: hypothetical protein J6J43_02190 [Oscillospiraceae bacterium]|nr:hypothetical protein [Oscillospiraceae bacterium]